MKKLALGALAALIVLVLAYPAWKPLAKRVKWFVILTISVRIRYAGWA